MLRRKRLELIFRLLLVCLVLGICFEVGGTRLSAKPSPGPVVDLAPTIEISNQAGDVIPSLTLSVNLADPLFPISQAVTINLKAKKGTTGGPREIKIVEVHFFDAGGIELSDAMGDPARRPGITLVPNPVGFTLPAAGTPVSLQVRPNGVFIRPGFTVFPISGGRIDFVGEFTLIDPFMRTTASLPINIVDVTPISALTVPTLSEWGLIVLALALLTAAAIFMRRRTVLMAGSTPLGDYVQFGERINQRLFAPRLFGKALAGAVALAVMGLAIVTWLAGPIEPIDIGGTILCSLVLAYLVHLLILSAKDSQTNRA